MAVTDLERLVVQLSADVKRYENGMNRARTITNRTAQQIEGRFAKMNRTTAASLGGAGLGIGAGIGRLAGGIGVAAAANEVRRYADAWTEAGNRIKAAEAISGKQARTLSQVNDIAAKTRSGISETSELYAKLLVSTRDVAKSEEEVARATEIVNKAFKAGGAAASEQAAGVLQLSQALGSGILQGDELRSIRENAPILAQAIATEFNTTIAGLKKLGEAGELEVGRVFKAILKAEGNINKAFNATQATTADGLRLLGNAATELFGVLNEVSGASAGFNEVTGLMAEGIRNMAAAMKEASGTESGQAFVKAIRETARLLSGLKTIDFIKGLAGDAASINDIRKQIAAMFAEYRKGLAVIKPAALSAFDDIAEKIEKGEIKADEAKQALLGIAGADSRLLQLPLALNPLIEKLQEVIDKANDAAKAVGGVSFEDPRQFDTSGKTESEFFGTRDAEARQTDQERELATRTQQLIAAAKDAGFALTEGAARVQAASEIAAENAIAAAEKAAEVQKTANNDINKSLIDTAQRFAGFNENTPTDRASLTDFFKAAGVNVDPKMTAWCAAFVNAVLATNGLPSSGSLMARSFLDYGTATQDPKPGDLVILKRGSGNVQGHVGFFMGDAANGGVQVLGGNQGDAVSTKTFAREDVLGFRQVDAEAQNESLARTIELREKQLAIVAQLQEAGQTETARIQLETALVGASNAERERQMFIFERLNELQASGVTITDALRASVEAEAAARFGAVASYDATIAAQERAAEAAERLREKQEELNAVQNEISGAFQGALKGLITDLVHGKDATEALYDAVSRLADRLLDIALDLLFQNLFGGLAGGLGGGGLLAGLFHSGGKAGAATMSRTVSPLVFAGAQRYHSGGLAGLKPGEVPAILQRGELVLPRSKVKSMAQGSTTSQNIDARTTVVNTFDAGSFLSEALSRPEGVKVVLNAVRAQPGAFRAAINA